MQTKLDLSIFVKSVFIGQLKWLNSETGELRDSLDDLVPESGDNATQEEVDELRGKYKERVRHGLGV